MARQTVNIGSAPNDGTGDPLRVAYDKLNDNFLEIYDDGGANITVNNPVTLTETTLDVALADIEAGGGAGAVTSVNSDTGAVIVDLQSATDEGNETTNDVIFRLDADKFIKIDSTNQVIQIFDLTIDAVNPIAYWNGTQISFADASNNVLDMSPTYFASNFADGSLWQFSGAILSIADGSGSMDLTPNALQFNAGASATLYSIDKITIDAVDYDLPTGASSQIATLLDIPAPITIDATPTDGSSNAVSSNGVFDALETNFEKAIIKDNYFWFSPNSVSNNASSISFNFSPYLSSSAIVYQGNSNPNNSSGMIRFASTSTAGTLGFIRRNDFFIITNYICKLTRKIRFETNISGQRFFCGFTKNNQFSAPTNVEPSTLTDIIGVCQLSTSTNMHVIHNDASGTATTIDLGSSYDLLIRQT